MIDSHLLPKMAGMIDGEWASADSGASFPVYNPANGELLADVPDMGAAECARAIDSASAVMKVPQPIEKRAEMLRVLGDSLLHHKQELGRIITLEHGKPHREGVAEVEYSAGFFHFFADHVERLRDYELPNPIRGCKWRVHLRPAGVAGAITSWNFPLAMISKKLAAALGAGCGVVIKPSGLAPISAIALATVAAEAGIRPGLINVVVGNANAIGETLCSHPAVRIISFTGSTQVGKILASLTAPHLKRLTLELGGNAPFIVFPDANLDTAVDALLANKFRAGGQTCVCANRVYVHDQVADEFIARTAERVKALKVGDGLDPQVDIGPLINRAAFDKVADHVQNALGAGATRVVGQDDPRPEQDWGCFFHPTLLVDVNGSMKVCREETFGPVVAVSDFSDEDQVVELANNTEYGLAAYLFTSDDERARKVTAALQFGHVGVNSGCGPTPEAPFGGFKHSGYGREGGIEGLVEYCEPQTEVVG